MHIYTSTRTHARSVDNAPRGFLQKLFVEQLKTLVRILRRLTEIVEATDRDEVHFGHVLAVFCSPLHYLRVVAGGGGRVLVYYRIAPLRTRTRTGARADAHACTHTHTCSTA